MKFNTGGLIVKEVWNQLPLLFSGIHLDQFILMPNHLHGIVVVGATFMTPKPQAKIENQGVMNHAPTTQEANRLNVGAAFMTPEPGSKTENPGVIHHAPTLGEIVRSFKAISTRMIRKEGGNSFSWQRNYYEHVIRRDESLDKIRQYILENPLKWEQDEYHISS